MAARPPPDVIDRLAAWAAGAAAGSTMTLIGHPFDTLKTRMQTNNAYASTWACARQTVAAEGLLAVYKGLGPALATTCLTSGLRFGVQVRENSARNLRRAMQIADATPRAAPQHHFNAWLVGALSPPLVTRDGAQLLRRRSSAATPTVSPHEFHDLSVGARILAEGGGGAACGLVLPLIFTPMELVKVRRQVMRDDAATSWELARAAWREGGVAALYTGHRFTVARSTLGNASLFGAFEAWKALLRSPFWPGGDVGAWRASVLAGVLSGWTTQLVTFPLDAAKSRAQVAGAAGGGGMLAALASLVREGAAYRGVSLNLIRAVPVHLAYLPVYGVIMTALTGASA